MGQNLRKKNEAEIPKKLTIFIIMIISISLSCYAEENCQPKAKGLEVVTDAANSVVDKADALLRGNLKITMSTEGDRQKDKDDYALDATGQRVLKQTLTS